MKITRAGTQPSAKGPADWFTGTVRIDPQFQAEAPGRVAGAAAAHQWQAVKRRAIPTTAPPEEVKHAQAA